MTAPSNAALAVSGFELNLVHCTPTGNRHAMLAKLRFQAGAQTFDVMVSERGYVMPAAHGLSDEMREAIKAEAHRVVGMALREAVIRGERARGVLRRLERKTTVTSTKVKATPYRPEPRIWGG